MSAPNPTLLNIKRQTRRVLRAVGDRIASLDPRFYYKPYVAWCHDLSWVEEYQPHISLDGRGGRRILDRRFTLLQFARSVANLPGCTAECGVARGVGSAVICKTLEPSYREGEWHFGFDSFEGLAEPTDEDRMKNGRHGWYKGKLAQSKQTAYKILADFPCCKVVKGWIPECFAPCTDLKFRMVHIDVDLHDATRDSLEFFYPRMVSGGVFVFDDHGFINCPGARSAADAFFTGKPERLVELATGQAFVIRH